MNKITLALIAVSGLSIATISYFQQDDAYVESDHSVNRQLAIASEKNNTHSSYSTTETAINAEKIANKSDTVNKAVQKLNKDIAAQQPETAYTDQQKVYLPDDAQKDPYSVIVEDETWLSKVSEEPNANSYERREEISRFITDNDELVALNWQTECGERMCGLLFNDLESEDIANRVIDIFSSTELKGGFVHHMNKVQDNGLYATRIILPQNKGDMGLIMELMPGLKLKQ